MVLVLVKGNDMARWAEFEKNIEAGFEAYSKAGVAELAMMPVPTAPAPRSMVNGPMPLRLLSGTAPFDVYGFSLGCMKSLGVGTMIGAEIKSTTHKETSIDISKGGVRPHQLESLAKLAKANGVAKIIWENGGEIGVLHEDQIVAAWEGYAHVLQMEEAGRKAPPGFKSIKWERFEIVDWGTIGGLPAILWLR